MATNTVRFLQGNSVNLNINAGGDASNLYFVLDTQEIYKGAGLGVPLKKFGDVLYGFTDLDDLKAKVPTGVNGKLYLTQTNQLYAFNGTYQLVAGSATMESFEASKVTYDKTNSTLTKDNVQEVIDELDVKVESNTSDIVTTTGRVDALETDNTQNKADIADLKAKEGLVKLDVNDASAFLGEKLDGVTVQVIDGKITVKGLDGLTVGTTELNHLTGITGNVQTQLNDLLASISASSSGMTFGNTINNKAELDALTNVVNGTVYIVLTDETKDNGRTMYVYSEETSSFVFVGLFEFAQKFIQLLDTPNAYEDGKVLKSTASGIIFTDQDYNDLINKPTSSIIDIDDAVTKKHSHTFDEVALNKIGEDTDGNLLFDGKQVKTELVWESFNI